MSVYLNPSVTCYQANAVKMAAAPSFKSERTERKEDLDADTFELEKESTLTKEDMQEIKHKARSKAAGWSVFGMFLSTAYYGLRSDKTIAKKYGLDVKKDKDFIREIRKDQFLWTLPGAFLPVVPALATWIYTKCQSPKDMTIKSA